MYWDGPYGAPWGGANLETCETFILIGGGIGVTPLMAAVRHLHALGSPCGTATTAAAAGGRRGLRRVVLCFVARTERQLKWFRATLLDLASKPTAHGMEFVVDLYVTRPRPPPRRGSAASSLPDDELRQRLIGPDDSSTSLHSTAEDPLPFDVHPGRPEWKEYLASRACSSVALPVNSASSAARGANVEVSVLSDRRQARSGAAGITAAGAGAGAGAGRGRRRTDVNDLPPIQVWVSGPAGMGDDVADAARSLSSRCRCTAATFVL